MARRSKRSSTAQVSSRLILDAGAVIALARGNQRVRAFLARAIEFGAEVFIPAVVVAETTRGEGPRDAPVNRVIRAVDAVPATDEQAARTAGRLLAGARSDVTIDALVVAVAIHLGGGRIVTSDPTDLKPLARGTPEIIVHRV